MNQPAIDHRQLYRLPWNLADNPIAWLEPTAACNLACDGCYRENVQEHKELDRVQNELDTFARLRNFDGVSIAGGDPLLHPQVSEIVKKVAAMGRKAILNTNGLALTAPLLYDLKRAGLFGLTFHVDSHQGRPGWKGKGELELNELRQSYADLVASVGGLSCSFNATVYEDTLEDVPALVDWAAENIGRVHTMVFITYRAAALRGFDYFVGGERVDASRLVYTSDAERRTDISSREVVEVIRRKIHDFAPCAYLNGTEKPDSLKWLLALRVGQPGRIHGYLGPRTLELTQAGYHLATGRYLGYAPPGMLAAGRAALLNSPWDPGARRAAWSYARTVATQPSALFRPLHVQSIMVIQPIDVLPDGRQNMCDGCPDMTVHDGELVWSCRLEEPKCFGRFLTTIPKDGASTDRPVLAQVRRRTHDA